ncbi:MAG: hypothetical protein Q9186_002388 [Xanthomendoza sp. 1 TL-2023]
MARQALLQRCFALTTRHAHQPSLRNTAQRRLASGEMPKLTGAADNAFNRERMAIFGGNFPYSKEAYTPLFSSIQRCLISLSVAVPSLIIAAINAKNLWDEHWEHWSHLPPLEDRIEYDYMNIRTKKFFWGDGDKTLL